jgi:hypothetical protein
MTVVPFDARINREMCEKGNIFVKPVPAVKVESLIEPRLKAFLDRVIIPALIEEFMKTGLATSRDTGAQSREETPKGELE